MAAYVATAVVCGVCAAVGLALLVLVTQACNRATVQHCNTATLQPCNPSYVMGAAALGAGGCNPTCLRRLP